MARPLSHGPDAESKPVRAGEVVWLVKVTGQYLTETGWIVGALTKAAVFRDRSKAFRFRNEHRENWLGRVYVVRRKGPLRDPQW